MFPKAAHKARLGSLGPLYLGVPWGGENRLRADQSGAEDAAAEGQAHT